MELKTLKTLKPTVCESNEILDPKYFSQFIVYQNLYLPCDNQCSNTVEISTATIEIDSTKIINTMKGTSIEGQTLTGKKLIILGKVNIKILIKYLSYKSCKNNICYLNKYIPFSTFIIIPQDICEEEEINLKYIIEDITAVFISKTKLFTSISILIQYADEY